MKPDIKSQSFDELKTVFVGLGEPGYRATQLLEAVYRQGAVAWNDLTTLPKALREKLAERFTFTSLVMVTRQGAKDSTQKFLWRLADGGLVESVLIPANP